MPFFREKPERNVYYMRKIECRPSSLKDAGLGVFATEKIKKHECFEASPVLKFHRDTMKHLWEATGGMHVLNDYIFTWANENTGGRRPRGTPDKIYASEWICVCWGYGCVYNHSDKPIARWVHRNEPGFEALEFIALRDIEPGEEIYIRYVPGDHELWFDSEERNIHRLYSGDEDEERSGPNPRWDGMEV